MSGLSQPANGENVSLAAEAANGEQNRNGRQIRIDRQKQFTIWVLEAIEEFAAHKNTIEFEEQGSFRR